MCACPFEPSSADGGQTGVAWYLDIDQAARNGTTKMIAASGAA